MLLLFRTSDQPTQTAVFGDAAACEKAMKLPVPERLAMLDAALKAGRTPLWNWRGQIIEIIFDPPVHEDVAVPLVEDWHTAIEDFHSADITSEEDLDDALGKIRETERKIEGVAWRWDAGRAAWKAKPREFTAADLGDQPDGCPGHALVRVPDLPDLATWVHETNVERARGEELSLSDFALDVDALQAACSEDQRAGLDDAFNGDEVQKLVPTIAWATLRAAFVEKKTGVPAKALPE